jgi:signal transduction histidine kinase
MACPVTKLLCNGTGLSNGVKEAVQVNPAPRPLCRLNLVQGLRGAGLMFNLLLNTSSYYLNPYAIPGILASVLILSIGLFVLKQNKKSVINVAFFLQCFSVSFWLFTISIVYLSRAPAVALFWYRYFTFFGVVNIMPSVYLFAVAWSGEFERKKIFVISNYIVSLGFYLLAIGTDIFISTTKIRHYFWGYYPVYKSWALVFLISFLIQFFIGFNKLHTSYATEKILVKKTQIRMVAVATLIAFTAAFDFLPKFFNFPLYPFGNLSMLTYIFLVAYSIVRYRTFDIETVTHKTIMWLLTFSFIIIPVFFLYRWVYPYIRESQTLQIVFWIISFLALTLYLRAIQPGIDHFFQRRRYNLEEISARFTADLVHLKGLSQLIQRIEYTIADTLYPQQIDVFIYHEDKKNYKLANVVSGSKKNTQLDSLDPFLLWLAKNNSIAYREFIDIDPAYIDIKENAKAYFKVTGALVVIPLALNEKLLGIINLGRKANLTRYSAADFHFLNILKNQSTIAISNSLLYENIEKQVRERTKELMEVQKQLIQAEKLATVGTLAGGVAHQINNPLTAILTNVQMLLTANPTDAGLDRESLELIEEATKRCRTIVQKLMTYAKKPLESAGVSEVDLLSVVKSAVSFLSYQLEQENINVIINAKEDDYFMKGNYNELEQVITNIILNARDAIKQIKKSGDIHILLSKENDGIKLQIKDEGAGIQKELMPMIFDPFFTTKEVGKGLGLGLSICQAIVEKHNGSITIESEVKRGTIVTVEFPKIITVIKVKSKVS